MKNIIIVGDSYAFGHGCSDRESYIDPITKKHVGSMELLNGPPSGNCWGSLIQRDYPDFNVINLSYSGDSNTRMIQRLFTQVEITKPDLIIFSGTGVFRMATANWHGPKGEPLANWVLNDQYSNVPGYIAKARESFVRYLFSPAVFISNSMMAVYAAYGIAKHYGAKIMWSLPVGDYCYKPEYDVSGLDEFSQELDFNLSAISNCRYTPHLEFMSKVGTDGRAIDGHFNDYGHYIYYRDVILPKLKETIGI